MEYYTLSHLCSVIESALAATLPSTYWVRAEIASLSTKSGHAYFELVEKAPDSILPIAKMRATCWAPTYRMLSAYFEQETSCVLRPGMQVLLEVEVSFHAAYGLSLNIHAIDPRFTLGDLAQQRQDTIRRLTEDGVIDLQRSLTLPTLTTRLAVISAESAAGWGDFLHQLTQPGYRLSATLFPAVMQGENAERSILNALSAIAERQDYFDAVAIIRGGGATTDLGCFDSYLLAATCAQFPLPIFTGIGHTRDVSVLDLVAYCALKTPTAVATFFVERIADQLESLTHLRQRLARTSERQILIRRHKLDMLQQRLLAANPERIYARGYSLTTNADGHIIRSIHEVVGGSIITTHLADGTITSTTH